ncbi:MAG: malic enzyme-like NAD(P)-binding protein [Microthrixaceae bacterium]
MAAAHALAASVNAREIGDSLLPPLADIREVSRAIAVAVAAQEQGLAPATSTDELADLVDSTMWQAEYRNYFPEPGAK